jgi:hypothetical protein
MGTIYMRSCSLDPSLAQEYHIQPNGVSDRVALLAIKTIRRVFDLVRRAPPPPPPPPPPARRQPAGAAPRPCADHWLYRR